MRFAVFISAGIGNAIFLIPLVKSLKERGKVTAILTSPFQSEEIFDGFGETYFDSQIDLRGELKMLKAAVLNFNKFDSVYMDYFSSNRRGIIISSLISREINCFHVPKDLPALFKRKIKLQRLSIGAHEGLQNLRLNRETDSSKTLSKKDFSSTPKKINTQINGAYITIQPGAGNNQTPWKVWELTEWINLLKKISIRYPELNIVILGDTFDRNISEYLKNISKQVVSLIDKTDLAELPSIISQSDVHIGGDSGLLHIAGAVNTKTITIVGGSDPNIFGWHKIDANRHRIIQHELNCHPCYRHYLPNQTRVTAAKNCPDFKCIRSITADEVFEVFNDIMIESRD